MRDTFADATDAVLDDIINELEDLQPDEETLLRQKYSRIHLPVAAALARGASSRQILELLKLKGLEIHHATFAKLFRAELAVRDESGDRMCCVTCGQSLQVKDPRCTEDSAPFIDSSENGEGVTL